MIGLRRGMGRQIRTTARLVGVVALLAVVAAPHGSAQELGGQTFDQFSVDGSAIPLAVSVAVPTYVPLPIDAGFGYTSVSTSSTPQVRATAEPAWVPVLSALDLLGGPGALVPIALGLVYDLVPSLPVVFGGTPLPFELPRLPLPPELSDLVNQVPVPSLQCIAATPGDTPTRDCGVPSLDLGGIKLQGVGAEATTAADPDDLSTVKARAEVNLGGIDTAEVGSLGTSGGYLVHSRTEQFLEDGKLVATAESSVADVNLFDAVEIDAVEARLHGRLDGVGMGTLERDCTLAGAKLMGVPFALTADGIRFGSAGIGADINRLLAIAPQLSQAFNRGVQSLSLPYDFGTLKIEVGAGAEKTATSERTVSGEVECLTISYEIPASTTGLVVKLGRASLNMSVSGGLIGGSDAEDDGGDTAGGVDGGVSVGGGGLQATDGGIDTSTPTVDTSLGGLDVPTSPEPTSPAVEPDPNDEVAIGSSSVAPRRADWTLAVPLAGLTAVASVVGGRLRRLRRLREITPGVMADG